ncbi:unnamed protein product [Moneuplotes crassus]|uniref:Uncharacterized protein n=1 Tax=Euplotes crassus TaxID=5936 RepID=A0AAD2D1T9_EUPCR|nr:unnamed protein product [Moneuplotes crassus]
MESERANTETKRLKDKSFSNKGEETKTLASDRQTLPSYGTIDSRADLKRFCLKTPGGKMVYAHAGSEPDSMMERISCNNEGWFGRRRSQAPNALENYFRAIDYLEQNIDFPLDSEDDPIESYGWHKHFFYIFTLLITILSAGSAFLAYSKKDQVAEDLTKTQTPGEKSSFLENFILICICVDAIFFSIIYLLSTVVYCIPKAKIFSVLSLISVISIISTLFLCYVHVIYLLTFIVRILYYVYLRYVVSILYTILLMPMPPQARNANNQDEDILTDVEIIQSSPEDS